MGFHLAQLNVARLLHPFDSAETREFVAGIEPVNQMAESAAGFVWRLKGEEEKAQAAHPWMQDPLTLANLSVWESVEALKEFVYRSGHLAYYRQRAEWFAKPTEAHAVLWWVPVGHRPDLQEAQVRLELLRTQGPTAEAFWFSSPFPVPIVAPK